MAKPPESVGIVARSDRKDRVRVAEELAKLLSDRVRVVVKDELSSALRLPGATLKEMRVDVVATVGGDGTILYALQHCHAPIFGVNTGELGFLTEVGPQELAQGVERLLRGDFVVEERMKLATLLNGEALPDATNEAVVKTTRAAKMLRIRIRRGDEILEEMLRADGLIVATPTGSTSYAMSAGGPIVDPSLEAMILVPIAPFKLSSRPHVLPATQNLEIELLAADKDAVVMLDGQFERALPGGDKLTFTGAKERAKFVRFERHGFERVRKHLPS